MALPPKRHGSGVVVASVSYPTEMERRRAELNISRSEAMQRGLRLSFDEAEGKETPDILRAKVEKLTTLLAQKQREIDLLRKWGAMRR